MPLPPRLPATKKKWGQHFLIDDTIARTIVTASGVKPGDRVVEIGPGPGALTTWLLRTTGEVWAVELDGDLLPHLQQRTAGLGTLHIQQRDILQVDFHQLAQQLGGELCIVANLPYNISTPLLMHCIEQRSAISRMTVMVQTEVAERLAATPGTKAYGALTIPCQLWMSVETLLHVPPTAFHPPPKVQSTVIQLVRRTTPLATPHDPALFMQVVRAAFGQRRKILANALGTLHHAPRSWLTQAHIDPQRRGETLSVAEFANLTNLLATERLRIDTPSTSPQDAC
ncbi:MAG: ribosomal RNA small subunit methyltransferase A [Magnetococcales bacterium]|nr:ribosomal RNA small subunit methyltransferase A [Magnetococcales bacterium]NGZ07695.1 ribosomal RNA small subunit methyltransferase A [Magnetococcales bacterium]